MRVLVELLDKEPIENVLGACIFEPEIVVYLCDNRDACLVKETGIYRLFRRRGVRTKPRFLFFDTTSPEEIRRILAAVAWDYPGCVFDYTGGRDLLLLITGAYNQAHELPGYYIDLPAGRFINVRGCGQLNARFAMPSFSAEDIFTLTDAAIKGSGHFTQGEPKEGFLAIVPDVWKIVSASTRAWGDFVAWLQASNANTGTNSLAVRGKKVQNGRASATRCNLDIAERLRKAGAIEHYTVNGDNVAMYFSSYLHKKCLLNQGIWLELACYVQARNSGLFDDVRTSVVVDWVNDGASGTKNEVDVLLVKGVTSIFISCKMSPPSPLALSEIMLLARKFGGQLGKPVVVTAARLEGNYTALKTRAADMGVHIFDRTALDNGSLPVLLAGLAQYDLE